MRIWWMVHSLEEWESDKSQIAGEETDKEKLMDMNCHLDSQIFFIMGQKF